MLHDRGELVQTVIMFDSHMQVHWEETMRSQKKGK